MQASLQQPPCWRLHSLAGITKGSPVAADVPYVANPVAADVPSVAADL